MVEHEQRDDIAVGRQILSGIELFVEQFEFWRAVAGNCSWFAAFESNYVAPVMIWDVFAGHIPTRPSVSNRGAMIRAHNHVGEALKASCVTALTLAVTTLEGFGIYRAL